ncbi:hypothetical protein Cgig2_033717 [Carnegiea gigantea]|uniref:RIN4 pathogenic type III effector avirulence factor Avr cleavage site domain-containing protein n=1 Tax=Carnegiea gigantea TaxID=171969 RepID=A0A9Q1QDR2_9CARY|nr:hypothetical protein Cgig2_033717 [Carnegiea gigantea]
MEDRKDNKEVNLQLPSEFTHSIRLLLAFVFFFERTVSWLSVPQFGDWDQKGGALPDYSLDFSKIREMRKQNKRDPSRASLGNEEDFINPTAPANDRPQSEENQHFTQNHSPTTLLYLTIECPIQLVFDNAASLEMKILERFNSTTKQPELSHFM